MRWFVPPDEPAAAKPQGRGFVDKGGKEGIDYVFYHCYEAIYCCYEVRERNKQADAQMSNAGRLHITNGQPIQWPGGHYEE